MAAGADGRGGNASLPAPFVGLLSLRRFHRRCSYDRLPAGVHRSSRGGRGFESHRRSLRHLLDAADHTRRSSVAEHQKPLVNLSSVVFLPIAAPRSTRPNRHHAQPDERSAHSASMVLPLVTRTVTATLHIFAIARLGAPRLPHYRQGRPLSVVQEGKS